MSFICDLILNELPYELFYSYEGGPWCARWHRPGGGIRGAGAVVVEVGELGGCVVVRSG